MRTSNLNKNLFPICPCANNLYIIFMSDAKSSVVIRFVSFQFVITLRLNVFIDTGELNTIELYFFMFIFRFSNDQI